jgi:hypothetical protein
MCKRDGTVSTRENEAYRVLGIAAGRVSSAIDPLLGYPRLND